MKQLKDKASKGMKAIANSSSQQTSTMAAKKNNAIDDIFKASKQKVSEKREDVQQDQQQIQKVKKQTKIQKKLQKQWKLQAKLRKLMDGQIPNTQRQEAGLKIYSQKDLNIGKGGNTSKCPIDCDCCF